jgi:hypothetical protein
MKWEAEYWIPVAAVATFIAGVVLVGTAAFFVAKLPRQPQVIEIHIIQDLKTPDQKTPP